MYNVNDYIKVVPSDPRLKDKIHVNFDNPEDTLYWYIKFNITLDEKTVTGKTATVTDVNGYILETDISYNENTNLIELSPLEPYEQDEYYILTISKKVHSKSGNGLKKDINILFKLKNNVISEYKILPPNVKVPKPIKRNKSAPPPNTRVYSFDKEIEKSGNRAEFFPSASILINPIVGGIGLIAVVLSMVFQRKIFLFISGVVTVLGVAHIIAQIASRKFRSNYIYNKGVRKFKKEKYLKAERCFEKALLLNPDNEYAEYAKNKLVFYK